jgi:pimeloyl-ACP methyl ester carboxylesterase
VWLRPEFLAWSIEDLMDRIDQPLLLIQGRDDEYGTLAQLDRIEAHVKGPTSRLVLSDCGHSPHRDQEAAVLEAIVGFVSGLA